MKSTFLKFHRLFSRHAACDWPKAVTVPLAIVVAVVDAWLSPLRALNGCGRLAVTTTGRREFAGEYLPPILFPE